MPAPASIDTATQRLMPLIMELGSRVRGYSAEEMALIERFLGDVSDAYRAGIDSIDPPPHAA